VDAALAALRAGARPEAAAEVAGVTSHSLTTCAAWDGELRAALDGYDLHVQRAARLADYLAALARTGGAIDLAVKIARVTREERDRERVTDEHFAIAEDAVLAMVGRRQDRRSIVHTPLSTPPLRRPLTDAEARELKELTGSELGSLVDELSRRGVHMASVAEVLGLARTTLAERMRRYRETGRWPLRTRAKAGSTWVETPLRALVDDYRARGEERLPTQRAIRELLGGGARATISAAVKQLADEGLIEVRPSGVFVLPVNKEEP
jgi:hypothetical protein